MWIRWPLNLHRPFWFGSRVATTRDLVGRPRRPGGPATHIPAGTCAEVFIVRFFACPYPYIIRFDDALYPDRAVHEDALIPAACCHTRTTGTGEK